MDHDTEIQNLLNNIRNRSDVTAEDGKWYALLSKIIPDFEQHEKTALDMVDKHGLIKALKAASKDYTNRTLTGSAKNASPKLPDMDKVLATCQMSTLTAVLHGVAMDIDSAINELGLNGKKYFELAVDENLEWIANKIKQLGNFG